MDDREIISLFFSREERAIKETALKYGKLIFRISHNILFSNEDSRECVNDTYLALWNTIPPSNPDPFIAFICKIARNLSIKKLRHKNAQKRSAEVLPMEELSRDLFTESVEESINAKFLGQSINSFLDTLDELSRVVFLKRYWFCDSVEDIAEITGMTENSVYKKLSATRKKLKIHLEKEGVFI